MKNATACSSVGCVGRDLLARIGSVLAMGAVTVALACGSAAGQGVPKTAPNINVTLPGPQRHNPPAGRAMPGTVEGFVYWETHAVTHNPAGACNGFSVSVIAGGHVLAAASGQFGAKPIPQVKSFLANGTVEVYDVCTYAYDNLPENTPLRVELEITQPTAFSTAVAAATPISVPLTIINARCNMLPNIATATLADLTAHWGSCQDMAFDVNFQLVPASAATRAAMLSPATRTLVQAAPGAANVSSSGGTLLNAGPNTTLLDRSQQPAGSAANSTLRPLVPRGSSNTGSSGTGATSLRPLIPRGSSTGGSNTTSSAGLEKPLTNADVLKLLRAGISEQNILTTIRTHRAAFDISNQSRATFDRECAAIGHAGLSAGAWGAEVADVWNTMNDVMICQETNGRGGEGSCVLKGNGRNAYEAITTERGVTQDSKFAKWAGGAGGTNTGTNNGNKVADDLSPQPYPPKSIAATTGSQTSGQKSSAALANARVPGHKVPITVKRSASPANVTILATLRKQRQAADAEEAQMMKLGIRPATLTGAPGPSQTMSASVGGSGTHLNGQATIASTATPATANAAPSYSQRTLMNSAARLGPSESLALICAQDPAMRILTVSGSSAPATFTPTDQYNLYTIRGCSFGSQSPTNDAGPTDWVHIYGGTGSFYGKFAIKYWSDNEIDVSLDESLTGFPDLNNITLVVERHDGQQTQKGGFNFYAARQWVPLTTIPQSWVTLDSFGGFVCGGSSVNKCWATNYSSPPPLPSTSWLPLYPGPATAPPGPSAASAYVSRRSNGLKNEGLGPSDYDYYDFSHLAPGWTTDPSDAQHQPQVNTYDEYCPAGGGWTVTYKQSFGTWSGQWDGNNLEIGLSETSCSGFIAPGFVNYQNISGSYYALQVWVIGPRGTDPLTDQPVH